MTTTWNAYEGDAGASLVKQYDTLSPTTLNAWMVPFLPDSGNLLEVGAGSGRDALWFSNRGLSVTCVEPSAVMREIIRCKLHGKPDVDVVDDCLPLLTKVKRKGKTFDVISVLAVWMHIHPHDRRAALGNMLKILNDDGVLCMSLRHGTPAPDRIMYYVTIEEVEEICSKLNAKIVYQNSDSDMLKRNAVHWTHLVIKKQSNDFML